MAPSIAVLALCAVCYGVRRAQAQIKVMGIGFGRTGTQTLKVALEMLGYKVFGDHIIVWQKGVRDLILRAEATKEYELIRQYIDSSGYNATTGLDFRQDYFWQLYSPTGTKAVLTMRGFESWYRSMFHHQFWEARYMLDRPDGLQRWKEYCFDESTSFLHNVLLHPLRTTDTCNFCVYWHRPSATNACRLMWERWLEGRRKMVSGHQHIEFNVNEGWEPLCRFLGLPVPQQPFPRYDGSTLNMPEFKAWKKIFLRRQALLFGLHFGTPVLLCAVYCQGLVPWCRGLRRKRPRRPAGKGS